MVTILTEKLLTKHKCKNKVADKQDKKKKKKKKKKTKKYWKGGKNYFF